MWIDHPLKTPLHQFIYHGFYLFIILDRAILLIKDYKDILSSPP
jgi:hypothetical protein